MKTIATSPKEGRSRLIDAPETRRSLEQMVIRLTAHRSWHEDLVQEALIHLWQEEQRYPGQRAGWYLRSCQFHLLNQMRFGRSIDSPKRRTSLVVPRDADSVGFLDSLADSTEGASVVEVVTARDLISELLQHLAPMEREVLVCLANGMGTRETARRLNLSHTCVARKRRAIAALLFKLEPQIRTKIAANYPNGRDRNQNGAGNNPKPEPEAFDPRSPNGFQFHARITSSNKSKEWFREKPNLNTIRP